MIRRATTLLLIVGVLVAPPAPATAQDGAPAAGAPAIQPETGHHHRLALDAIVRMMIERLRATTRPTIPDYTVAARVLAIYEQHFPQDEEMLRLQIDAWRSADEDAREIAATRRLLRLDPDDDVAILRLISDGIRRKQHADARLAAYDRFLNAERFAQLPALRSRLAFDAALLARELGDEGAYLDYLLLATQSDPTNKEAAALFATEYLDRTDDPIARIELLANIVLADPLDPQVHQNLAHELLAQGAYRGAKRFIEFVSNLLIARGGSLSPEQLFDYHLCIWADEGPEACIEPLREMHKGQIEGERRYRESLEEQGLDPGPEQEVTLPNALERLRLAVHIARDDLEAALESLRMIQLNFDRSITRRQERIEENKQLIEDYKDPLLWPRGYSQQKADEDINAAKQENERLEREIPELRIQNALEGTALRTLAGLELERARQDIEFLREQVEKGKVEQHAIDRFEGAIAAHEGDLGRARELLEPLAEQGDVLAEYALAVAHDKAGNEDEALRRYASLFYEHPNTALGAIGRTRVEQARDVTVRPSEVSQAVNEYAMDLAPWLGKMTTDPRSFMSLTAEFDEPIIGPLDRPVLHVTLRNVSRWPLAVGIARPINSRILLAPSVLVQGQQLQRLGGEYNETAASFLKPEILSLDRRIRLGPGEQMDASVWVAKGGVGTVLDRFVLSGISMRWRAVQGFLARDAEAEWLPDDAKRYEKGPLCVSAMSNRLERRGLGRPENTDEVLGRIAEAQGDDLFNCIMLIGAWAQRLAGDQSIEPEEQDRQIQQVADAFNERIPELNDSMRAYAVCILAPYGYFDTVGQGQADRLREGGGTLTLLAQIISPELRNENFETDPRIVARCRASENEHLRAIGMLFPDPGDAGGEQAATEPDPATGER